MQINYGKYGVSESEAVEQLKSDLLSGAFVPALAENLFSPTDLEQSNQSFIKRTTGGSASVRSGEAILSKVKGNAVVPSATSEVLTIAHSEVARFEASVTEDYSVTETVIVGVDANGYTYTQGSAEPVNKTASELMAIGINLDGSMEVGDTFTITYNEGEYSITHSQTDKLTVSMTDEGKTTFRAFVASRVLPGASIVVSLHYDGNGEWYEGETGATLSDYGITLSGTAANGDTITVNYTRISYPTITFPTPTAFKGIGFNSHNCFDPASMVLEGYTINAQGNVVAQAGSYLCWAPAVHNSDNASGYTVYDKNSKVVRAGWLASVPTASSTGIDLAHTTGDAQLSHITFTADGYICVATTDASGLCIHPTWSGYLDKVYAAYSESVITLPTKDADGNDLVGQFWAVGSNRNYLDLVGKVYHKVVTRTAYTEAALAALIAAHPSWVSGVDYIHDNDWIYHTQTEQTVNLPASTTSHFVCNDFSIEEFVGTAVAPYADFVYGQNLVDKLRTDVVTTSTIGQYVPLASEVFTISSWSDLASAEPFAKKAEVTAQHTIGSDTIVELVNDNAVAFANYGFQIGAIAGQVITLYALDAPTSAVNLTIKFTE